MLYLYGLSELRELVMDWEAGVLQSMGLQSVGHDWATELTELNWWHGGCSSNCGNRVTLFASQIIMQHALD